MEKLEFLFSLLDRLSGPAKSMQKATGGVATELDKVNEELQKLDRQAAKTRLEKVTDPLQKQRLQLRINRDELRHQQHQLKSATQATEGFSVASMAAGGILGNLATGALSMAAGAVQESFSRAVDGAKFVTEALAFKETTLTALKVMTGTEASAQRIFNDALVFAKRTPFETNQVVGGFTQLLGAGFKESEVTRVFAAIGDAAAASGFDTQVVDRMVLAFSQIKAKGRLMGQEMLQVNEALARTGVGTADIYREIGKAMGVSAGEALKLQEAGKIGSDTAIFGILKALEQRSGGAVGNLMAAQSKTLTGLLSTLKSAPQDLVLSMDLTKMPGFDAVKGTVDNLAKALDTTRESGQRLQAALGTLFNSVMAGLFGAVSGEDGLAKMETVINRVSDAVQTLAPFIRVGLSVLRGFAEGMFSAYSGAAKALGIFNAEGLSTEALEAFGEKVGKLAGTVMTLAAPFVLIGNVINFVRESFSSLWDKLSGAASEAKTTGSQIGSGLAEGILSMTPFVSSAALELASAASGAVRKALDIHSPSRVFAEYGAFTAEGFAQGVRGSTGDAADAVEGLGDARPQVRGGTRALGAGGVNVPVNVNLILPANASGDAKTFAEQVRDALVHMLPEELPGALQVAFSGLAVEGGEG